MKLPCRRFNWYLSLALLTALAGGCASTGAGKKQKDASCLRLYLEASSGGAAVPIYRADPKPVMIQREPFLDERSIVNAAVVDVVGGFAIQVQYDYHGMLALETVTTANKGRRIAIHCLFTEGRWLAAPVINTAIRDGVITFTPDCTRDEAERIVRGLNNLAEELGNRPKTKPAKKPKSEKKAPAEPPLRSGR